MSGWVWGVPLVVAVATWIGTGLVRRFAIARALLDHPNQRSSHTAPTPRGGGLAFVVAILAGLVTGWAEGALTPRVGLAMVPAGALVAIVGWLDDRSNLSAGTRFLCYAAGACWLVAWLGPVERVALPGRVGFDLGIMAWPVTVLALVWLANAFNFMDGVDGIAAGTALVVGASGAALAVLSGASQVAWVALVIAAGAAGFLPWNWMPARIFMGDVGSVFLGLLLGGLGLMADGQAAVPAVLWGLLLGPFLFDATVTLGRRVVRGERWSAAHRNHAYQRAVQAGHSHARVAAVVLLLTAGMGILAWGSIARPRWAPLFVTVGLAALGVAYLGVERQRPMDL